MRCVRIIRRDYAKSLSLLLLYFIIIIAFVSYNNNMCNEPTILANSRALMRFAMTLL